MNFSLPLLVFLLFHNSILLAQENESTLDEILIETKKKTKTTKLKLTGYPAYNNFHKDEKIITRVLNIPEGKLTAVSFYFNTGVPNLIKKELNIQYIDVELGLLVYEVNENGSMGRVISEDELTFWVKKNHKGALKIDISSLGIYQKDIYIGFNVLSDTNWGESNIYVRLFESQKHKSFTERIISNRFLKTDWTENDLHLKLALYVVN